MDWQALQDQFREMMIEEDRIVEVARSTMRAMGNYESRSYGEWQFRDVVTDSLRVRFELAATQAALILDPPYDMAPWQYWLHRVTLFLEREKSNLLRSKDGVRLIFRVCEASMMLCAAQQREELEKAHLGTVDQMRLEIERALQATSDQDKDGPITESASSSPTKSIAEQLEAFRVECDLTQQKLSDEVGMELRTVQRHLSGESRPLRRAISAYEKYFSKRLNQKVVITNLS